MFDVNVYNDFIISIEINTIWRIFLFFSLLKNTQFYYIFNEYSSVFLIPLTFYTTLSSSIWTRLTSYLGFNFCVLVSDVRDQAYAVWKIAVAALKFLLLDILLGFSLSSWYIASWFTTDFHLFRFNVSFSQLWSFRLISIFFSSHPQWHVFISQLWPAQWSFSVLSVKQSFGNTFIFHMDHTSYSFS